MALRLCLSTANTLSYPQGGYLWVFINWALGFRACGCDVAWLDVVPPSMPAEEVRVATDRLRNALRPFGLDTAVLVGHLTEEPASLSAETTGVSGLFPFPFPLCPLLCVLIISPELRSENSIQRKPEAREKILRLEVIRA